MIRLGSRLQPLLELQVAVAAIVLSIQLLSLVSGRISVYYHAQEVWIWSHFITVVLGCVVCFLDSQEVDEDPHWITSE